MATGAAGDAGVCEAEVGAEDGGGESSARFRLAEECPFAGGGISVTAEGVSAVADTGWIGPDGAGC